MDKKSKILLFILAILIIASVGYTFYKYVIVKDYQMTIEVSCDRAVDNCFIRTEDDGTKTDYKILDRNASNIPLCDPDKDETCRAKVCEPNELNCSITTCSEADLPEGESCSR